MKKFILNLILITIGTIIIVGLMISVPIFGEYKWIPLTLVFMFFLFGVGVGEKFEMDMINSGPEPDYPLNKVSVVLYWYGIVGLILLATKIITSADIIYAGAILIFIAVFVYYSIKIKKS